MRVLDFLSISYMFYSSCKPPVVVVVFVVIYINFLCYSCRIFVFLSYICFPFFFLLRVLFLYSCLIFLILVQHVLFRSSILYNFHKMFLTRYQPLCTDCRQRGFTSRDTSAYRCSACGHSFGRQKFGEQDIKHFKTRPTMRLYCTECK